MANELDAPPGKNLFAPGFRFFPTPQDLVGYFLYNYVQHIYDPDAFFPIRRRDIYNEEPWELWQTSQIFPDKRPEKGVYFFADLRKTKDTCTKLNRKAGRSGGNWHGENAGDKVELGSYVHAANWVAFTKRFSYKNLKHCKSEHKKWILYEYSISKDGGSNYLSEVVCVLRNNRSPTAKQFCAAFERKAQKQRPPIEAYISNVIRAGEYDSDGRSQKRVCYANSAPSTNQPTSIPTKLVNSVFDHRVEKEKDTCSNYVVNSSVFECNQNPYYRQDKAPMLQVVEFGTPTIWEQSSCSNNAAAISTYQFDSLVEFGKPTIWEQSSTSNAFSPYQIDPLLQFGNTIWDQEQGSTITGDYHDPLAVMEFPLSAGTSDGNYQQHQFSGFGQGYEQDSFCYDVGGMPLGMFSYELQNLLYPSTNSAQTAPTDVKQQQQQQQQPPMVPNEEQQQKTTVAEEAQMQVPLPVIPSIVLEDDDDDDSWLGAIDFDCDASWSNFEQNDLDQPAGIL